MPRKTVSSVMRVYLLLAGFNEAAARCRGKPVRPIVRL